MKKFLTNRVVPSIRDPFIFFIVAAGFFGLFYVATNPPGFGLDERAHFLRSYSISKGEFLPRKIGADQRYGSYIPQSLVAFVGTSTSDILDNNQAVFVIHRHDTNPIMYEQYKKRTLSETLQDVPLVDSQVLAAVSYSPFGYLHFALTVLVGRLVNAPLLYILYATRLAGLFLYILLVGMAIKITTRYKWMIVSIALLPVALAQAASISLDPLVNAGALLLVAEWVKINDKSKVTKQDYWTIVTVLVLIALTKFTYLILLFPFLFLGVDMFASRKVERRQKVSWVLVPGIIMGWWLVASRHITKMIVLLQPGHANTSEQLHNIITHPVGFLLVLVRTHYESIDHTLGALFARMGDRQIGMPNAFMYLFVVMICLVLTAQYQKESDCLRKTRWHNNIIIVSIIGVIVLISLTLFITFTPVGADFIQGIQGRYLIPVLPITTLLLFNQRMITVRAPRYVENYGIQVLSTMFILLSFGLYYLANY